MISFRSVFVAIFVVAGIKNNKNEKNYIRICTVYVDG